MRGAETTGTADIVVMLDSMSAQCQPFGIFYGVCHLLMNVGRCRFHALWYQGGHVCSEPLTTAHHFIDLRVSNPAYMEGLVKMVTAFGQLVADLSDSMAPCVEA